MGLVLMSERALQRIEVLAQVLDGSLRTATAARLLELRQRQVQRLVRKVQAEGAMAVRHKLRGRPSNNRTSELKRDYILSLIRRDYPDFGPTLAAGKLAERHGIRVSSESLRQWMLAAGLWQSRAQKRHVHQPRLRREALGELIQIDGSEHRWFEDRGPACTLLVFIDDATSRLMQDAGSCRPKAPKPISQHCGTIFRPMAGPSRSLLSSDQWRTWLAIPTSTVSSG